MTSAAPPTSRPQPSTGGPRPWRAVRERIDACWTWLEARPTRALMVVLACAAAVRLPFLTLPLETDEGGFLMVAGQWHGKGSALYTDQWVDRPPLLLVVFKVADWLGGGAVVLRLMAMVFGSILIVAAWYAGRVIHGAQGAVMAAVVAGAFSASFAIDGSALTGECIAGAFVMTSCALVLEAKYGGHRPRAAIACALLAGVFAASAFLTKQNFLDAAVFAGVLLCAKLHQLWRLVLAGIIGLLIPIVLTVLWAESPEGPGVGRLLVAMFRFRQRSLNVIEDANLAPPLDRLQGLGMLVIGTGLLLMILVTLVAARRTGNRHSLRLALVVMLGYVVLSILAGASWWRHYLLQLTVVTALGAALATKLRGDWQSARLPATWAVVATLVATGVGMGLPPKTAHDEQTLARYLAAASDSDDTLMLAYGAPNVIEEAGLSTPYRYSWSLPIRTRDPQLTSFVSTLRGPHAPTWLVEIGRFSWWDLDNAAFQQVRKERYRVVARVCGHDIYLRDGMERRLPPVAPC